MDLDDTPEQAAYRAQVRGWLEEHKREAPVLQGEGAITDEDAIIAARRVWQGKLAEGGLAVALAECCLAGGLGAEIAIGVTRDASSKPHDIALAATRFADPTEALFGEGPGGFVVSGLSEALAELAPQAPLQILGTVASDTLTIATGAGVLSATLAELAEAHGALAELFP